MSEIILKLILAIVLGGLIGVEREFSHKPAGLRTNILICIGSAVMMILSEVMLAGKGASTGDSLRIAAGAITGMGFIGAGTIIQSRGVVHGLTTASTLWAVTGLGLVIGAGYYLIGIVFTGLVILTLVIFHRIEDALPKKCQYYFHLRGKERPGFLGDLKELAKGLGIKLEDISLKKDKDFYQVGFHFQSSSKKGQALSQNLAAFGEILEYRED
jgi:putative Mg2+ transporter-C (MgtC) family protein